MTPSQFLEGGEVVIPLADRILGRTAAEDVVSPIDEQTLLPANGMIDEEIVSLFEEHNVNQVMVRSRQMRCSLTAERYGSGTIFNIISKRLPLKLMYLVAI